MNKTNIRSLKKFLIDHYASISCFEMCDGLIINVETILFATDKVVCINDKDKKYIDIANIVIIDGVEVEEILSYYK